MRIFRNTYIKILAMILSGHVCAVAQNKPQEEDYYRMTKVPVPEGISFEVGGMLSTQDASLAVTTRRGDVWIVENPTMQGGTKPNFKLFAEGLHEPLGLAMKQGAMYIAQRSELTKLKDTDGDRRADEYETIYSWPVSTHYHEYVFGPVIGADDNLYVTMNVAFGNQEWWRGESRVPWKGWMLRITEDGEMTPWATGLRSPAGLGTIGSELFYTENQGDWVGSGGLFHIKKGSFVAHPAGLKWSSEPNSPVEISEEEFYAVIDKRQVKKNGRYIKPDNIPNEEDPDFLYEAKEKFPQLQLPAVILPHGIMGISNSQFLVDETNGKFGPFEGQVFVGDQGQSKIMRIDLEKINGEYQGVAFDFRSGFQSGVMRMAWDSKGNLFAGETNRGWGSAGTTNSGLEFLSWTGKVPFEMKTVKSRPDGFEIEFTKPIDRASAEYLDAYYGKSYIYKYHAVYGSPQTNLEELKFKGVKISDDGMKLRVVVDNFRQYYVHEIILEGIKSKDGGDPLLHQTFYYTLNNIPEGAKLPESELTAKKRKVVKKPVRRKTSSSFNSHADNPNAPARTAVLSDAEAERLMTRNTCSACHKKDKRLVGPSFQDIAKRKYSDQKIVDLIYNPQPKNWPEYATPMAPMPQVPKDQALKLAAWINSLR